MIETRDLAEVYKSTYLMCLEDWSDEMKEAGDRKAIWYDRIKDEGLRVKVAIDENGNAVGMIQYIPIEQSFAYGENLYHILCIWVHGYDKDIENFQNRGIGKLLLEAAEKDVNSLGSDGISAWGISLPFWMKASWFKKQGFLKVDKQGPAVLLWKPFNPNAQPPK
jgi:GNAT superfamily N-acetyltransferase